MGAGHHLLLPERRTAQVAACCARRASLLRAGVAPRCSGRAVGAWWQVCCVQEVHLLMAVCALCPRGEQGARCALCPRGEHGEQGAVHALKQWAGVMAVAKQ
eukprot:1159166-Pelagomonas_calceolata.AAC.3